MTCVTVKLIVAVLVKPSEEPVTVTATVPVAAVGLADSESELVVVVLLGLNEAVTPLGSPEAERLMVPLKPPCRATVMVLEPLEPWGTVSPVGAAEIAKLPCGFTIREIVTVLVKVPEVPVIVTGKFPTAAVPAAVRVSVLVVAVVAGLNDAVTPAGKPEADKLTLPLKPNWGVMVMVFVLVAPCVMVMLLSDVEREKFGEGGAGVVRETLSKVAVAKEDVLRLLTANPT